MVNAQSKADKALMLLMEQIKEGKYTIRDYRLFNKHGKEMKSLSRGYIRHCVRSEGFKGYVLAHRLMYFYHHGTIDPNLTINHKDGNKLNNHPDNLEQVTRGENTKHSIDTGLQNVKGSGNGFSKLNEEQVKVIRELLAQRKIMRKEIAAMFNISLRNVYYIQNDTAWRHVD